MFTIRGPEQCARENCGHPNYNHDHGRCRAGCQCTGFVDDVGPPCPHCGKARKRESDYLPPTCGRSECQQAEYQANAERARPKRRARR